MLLTTKLSVPSSDNNTFDGEVPIAYFVGFPKITEIDMSGNALSGFEQDALDQVGDLPNLERLNLGMCQLSCCTWLMADAIFWTFFSLLPFKFWQTAYNSFRGQMPTVFNRFNSLKILNLSK